MPSNHRLPSNSINNNDCSNNNTLSPSTSSGCLVSVIKWPHDLPPLRGLTRCALRDGFPQTLVVKNDDQSGCCLSIIRKHAYHHSPLTSAINVVFFCPHLLFTEYYILQIVFVFFKQNSGTPTATQHHHPGLSFTGRDLYQRLDRRPSPHPRGGGFAGVSFNPNIPLNNFTDEHSKLRN